jgi:hypothetical protein
MIRAMREEGQFLSEPFSEPKLDDRGLNLGTSWGQREGGGRTDWLVIERKGPRAADL